VVSCAAAAPLQAQASADALSQKALAFIVLSRRLPIRAFPAPRIKMQQTPGRFNINYRASE